MKKLFINLLFLFQISPLFSANLSPDSKSLNGIDSKVLIGSFIGSTAALSIVIFTITGFLRTISIGKLANEEINEIREGIFKEIFKNINSAMEKEVNGRTLVDVLNDYLEEYVRKNPKILHIKENHLKTNKISQDFKTEVSKLLESYFENNNVSRRLIDILSENLLYQVTGNSDKRNFLTDISNNFNLPKITEYKNTDLLKFEDVLKTSDAKVTYSILQELQNKYNQALSDLLGGNQDLKIYTPTIGTKDGKITHDMLIISNDKVSVYTFDSNEISTLLNKILEKSVQPNSSSSIKSIFESFLNMHEISVITYLERVQSAYKHEGSFNERIDELKNKDKSHATRSQEAKDILRDLSESGEFTLIDSVNQESGVGDRSIQPFSRSNETIARAYEGRGDLPPRVDLPVVGEGFHPL